MRGGKSPIARSTSPDSRRACNCRNSTCMARNLTPGASLAKRRMRGGISKMMPTSLRKKLKVRSLAFGLKSLGWRWSVCDASRIVCAEFRSSNARDVGSILSPTRTNRGSSKYRRNLARHLLTAGWEVSRICAARVRLRSRTNITSVRKWLRFRASIFRPGIISITFWG